MADAESTVALSIGSQRISMAVFDAAKGGGLILKSYGSSSILADPAQEMARLPQISIALKELAGSLKIHKQKVRYAMSGQSVFTRFVKLPALDDDNIDQLVAFEAQQHVPFPIDEVVWDWQLLESTGPEKEVALVAIKGDALSEINDTVAEAGLGTKEVDAAPMALYNAFRYNYPDVEEPVLLMDIGAKATDLIYIEGNRMFTRSIAVGSASVTTAIAKEYNVSFAEAETQKITNGMVSLGGGHTDQLDEASAALATTIRNSLNRLPAEVARTNNYYRSQHEGGAPAHVFLAGGGANMPYLTEFLEEKLRLPIEKFNPFKRVSVAKNVDVEQLGLEAHMFGELVGLALRGVDQAKVNIDLVPDVVASERATAQRKPFLIAAALIIVAGMGVWALNKMSMANEARAKADALTAENRVIQPVANKVESLKRDQSALTRIGEAYTAAQVLQVEWLNILMKTQAYFNDANVWITDFEPVANYKKGDFESAEEVVKNGFETGGYGTSSVNEIRVKAPAPTGRTTRSSSRKQEAPKPAMINAIRIKGAWRNNAKGSRVVNDVIERIKEDPSIYDLTISTPARRGKTSQTEPMEQKEIFEVFKTSIGDINAVAEEFVMYLPLANPIPLN